MDEHTVSAQEIKAKIIDLAAEASVDASVDVSVEIGVFKPYAKYDKQMDCIRVRLDNIAFREERVNKLLTLQYPLYSGDDKGVGFILKGVNHIYKTAGLDETQAYTLAQILDFAVSIFPDQSFNMVREQFGHSIDQPELAIRLKAA